MSNVIVTFPEGKFKVLTMSYDDGKTADRKLVEIFNRYGIKGTFHLNGGLLGTPGRLDRDEAADLYQGHEISAHTLTHPSIARSPKEELVKEVIEDRKRLEEMTNYPVRGMSYPNGSFTRQIKALLPFLGIEYARTVNSTQSFTLPDDFF